MLVERFQAFASEVLLHPVLRLEMTDRVPDHSWRPGLLNPSAGAFRAGTGTRTGTRTRAGRFTTTAFGCAQV